MARLSQAAQALLRNIVVAAPAGAGVAAGTVTVTVTSMINGGPSGVVPVQVIAYGVTLALNGALTVGAGNGTLRGHSFLAHFGASSSDVCIIDALTNASGVLVLSFATDIVVGNAFVVRSGAGEGYALSA